MKRRDNVIPPEYNIWDNEDWQALSFAQELKLFLSSQRNASEMKKLLSGNNDPILAGVLMDYIEEKVYKSAQYNQIVDIEQVISVEGAEELRKAAHKIFSREDNETEVSRKIRRSAALILSRFGEEEDIDLILNSITHFQRDESIVVLLFAALANLLPIRKNENAVKILNLIRELMASVNPGQLMDILVTCVYRLDYPQVTAIFSDLLKRTDLNDSVKTRLCEGAMMSGNETLKVYLIQYLSSGHFGYILGSLKEFFNLMVMESTSLIVQLSDEDKNKFSREGLIDTFYSLADKYNYVELLKAMRPVLKAGQVPDFIKRRIIQKAMVEKHWFSFLNSDIDLEIVRIEKQLDVMPLQDRLVSQDLIQQYRSLAQVFQRR